MIYIDTQEELSKICEKLEQEETLGFDCEFMRETTFVPVLCLVQIASKKHIYIIDPMRLDMAPVLKLLTDPRILKVMHSCVQDMDVFFKNFSVIPNPVFDTQIAASFLGYGDSISYAKLVKKLTGNVICKESKLANWQQRPLANAELKYAANDVRHLHEMHDKLSTKLEKTKRTAWVEEEVFPLYEMDNYYLDPELAWQKISQNKEVDFFLNYLRAFARYREHLAITQNKPRRFVLRDEVLVRLAKLQPHSQEDINKDRVLKKLLPKNLIPALLEISWEASQEKEELVSANKHKLTSKKELICDLLKLYLKYVSQKEKISLKNIAKTKDIESFVHGKKVKFLSGWRYEIFGKTAEEIVAGERLVLVENGEITIKPTA